MKSLRIWGFQIKWQNDSIDSRYSDLPLLIIILEKDTCNTKIFLLGINNIKLLFNTDIRWSHNLDSGRLKHFIRSEISHFTKKCFV